MIGGSKLAFAVLATVLAACTLQPTPLAGYQGLTFKIQSFYADHAVEENGTCRAPEMRAITDVRVLEETEDRLVLRLRYYFQDDTYGVFDDPEIPFGRLRCRGFRTRDFVIDKRDGLRVVGMSGPTREDRNFGRPSGG